MTSSWTFYLSCQPEKEIKAGAMMACTTDLQELRLSLEFLIFVPHPPEEIDALVRQLLHPSR